MERLDGSGAGSHRFSRLTLLNRWNFWNDWNIWNKFKVLIGTNDRARSNHLVQAEALTKRIPGAELKVLDGQSHGFFWQAPEETNRIILDWVKQHSAVQT